MGAKPGDPEVLAHIESICTRAEPETDRLVLAMLHCCWPGGMGDRTETVAHQTNVPEMFRTPEARAGMESSFDKMAAYLASR